MKENVAELWVIKLKKDQWLYCINAVTGSPIKPSVLPVVNVSMFAVNVNGKMTEEEGDHLEKC